MAIGGDRTFVLKILADYKDATAGLDKVETKASGFAGTASKLGGAIGGALAVGAVVEFGRSVVNAASDAEQALGGATAIFGDYAGQIEEVGKKAATNMGLSNEEFLRLSTLTGALLKNAGLPMDEVAKSTEALTGRAADLSAMFGGPASDAVDSINSAMKGEFDSLEKYGISLKASTIEARAMAEGYVDASGNVTNAGKAIATQELIMEQSADAAGTFGKESGSLAGQTQIMQAKFKDLQATLGEKLLPVIVKVMDVVVPMLTFIANNIDWIAPLAGGILGIVAAVKTWTIVQGIFNVVMSANPIALIVIAIAALVAGLILAYQKSETFREIVQGAMEAVSKAAEWVVGAIGDIWEWLQKIPEWMGKIKDSIVEIGGKIFDAYTWPYRTAWDIVRGIFDTLKDVIYKIPGFISTAFNSLKGIIEGPFVSAKNGIMYVFDGVMDFFYKLPGRISGFFGGLADIIKYPFSQAFDGIKYLWNNTLGRVNFTIPGWVPGVGGKSFAIPKMASGGIITGPTLALLGEAGPEAVIPLNGNMGMGTTNNYYVSVQALNPTSEVGRLIAESLREHQRTAGGAR